MTSKSLHLVFISDVSMITTSLYKSHIVFILILCSMAHRLKATVLGQLILFLFYFHLNSFFQNRLNRAITQRFPKKYKTTAQLRQLRKLPFCTTILPISFFHFISIFILMTRRKVREMLMHRANNSPTCFQRCQDIAVRLKFLIWFSSFIEM